MNEPDINRPGHLTGRTVHIWRIDHSPPAALDGLTGMLSPAEHARAERLNPAFRNRYRTQRIVLRLLLSRYLDVPPEAIEFAAEGNGKPCLGGSHAGQLHFNLSDTGGVFIIGFTAGGPVGIDMERCDRTIATARLANRICTTSEQAMLAALPEDQCRNAVLRLWVRKEAILKGLGHGIKVPMRLAGVDGESPAPVRFSPDMPGVDPAACWHVADIDIDDQFMVTIAIPWAPEEVGIIQTTAAAITAQSCQEP